MQLTHFSEKNTWLEPINYYLSIGDKPDGLWVSCPTSPSDVQWDAFVEKQGCRSLRTIEYVYNVEMDAAANVLVVSTLDEMNAFTDTFGNRRCNIYPNAHPVRLIDWRRVAERYQGILITPYLPNGAEKYFWYQSWGIASGCIWDLEAIAKFEQMEVNQCLNSD